MIFDEQTELALRVLIRDEVRQAVENSVALIQEGEDNSPYMIGSLYTLETLHQTLQPQETLQDVFDMALGEVRSLMEEGSTLQTIDSLRDLADLLERYDAKRRLEPTPADVDAWAALQDEDDSLAQATDHHPEFERPANAGSPGVRSIAEAREAGESGRRGIGDAHLDEEPPTGGPNQAG